MQLVTNCEIAPHAAQNENIIAFVRCWRHGWICGVDPQNWKLVPVVVGSNVTAGDVQLTQKSEIPAPEPSWPSPWTKRDSRRRMDGDWRMTSSPWSGRRYTSSWCVGRCTSLALSTHHPHHALSNSVNIRQWKIIILRCKCSNPMMHDTSELNDVTWPSKAPPIHDSHVTKVRILHCRLVKITDSLEC